MSETHIDEIIDYPFRIIQKIGQSQAVTSLVLNDQDIDMSSDEAEKVYDHLYDYDYVDDTITEGGVYITVDCDVDALTSSSFKTLDVYIQVNCSKNMMRLSGWKGVRGSRLANVCRQIDLLITGSREFGVGRMQLDSCKSVVVTKPFAAKLLHYKIPNFAVNRDRLSE